MKAAILALLGMFAFASFGHGGGLDASGGHHDRKRGGYHYHRTPKPAVPDASGMCCKRTRIDGGCDRRYKPMRVPCSQLGISTPRKAVSAAARVDTYPNPFLTSEKREEITEKVRGHLVAHPEKCAEVRRTMWVRGGIYAQCDDDSYFIPMKGEEPALDETMTCRKARLTLDSKACFR